MNFVIIRTISKNGVVEKYQMCLDCLVDGKGADRRNKERYGYGKIIPEMIIKNASFVCNICGKIKR